MPTYVGVLRAINLGSHNKIAMSDLRAMLERVGCEEPRTLLLSGNVVFRNASSSIEKVERMLEEASTKHLGVTTDYFVRTAREWQAIIDDNPFPKEAKSDPVHLLMMCLRDTPSPAHVKATSSIPAGSAIRSSPSR